MGVATVEMEKVERVGIYWEVGFLVFCLFVWVLEGSRGGERRLRLERLFIDWVKLEEKRLGVVFRVLV